tara:strand:- start:611 stop:802 length:192 start_codon:yes stop_codon:yes gene_type:complete
MYKDIKTKYKLIIMFTEIAVNIITATILLFYTWKEFVRNLENLREEFGHLNYIEYNNTNNYIQ